MISLKEFVQEIPNFSEWSFTEKIKFFGWYLHTQENKSHFASSNIEKCFNDINLAPPSAINPFLRSLEQRKKKELLKTSSGYCLEMNARQFYDKTYGSRESTVRVHEMLANLPVKIPDLSEKAYLDEAIICFRHKAFRAAIVMCWNLVFGHLCDFVFKKNLSAFNLQLSKSFPKETQTIIKLEDFNELKESQVLQVCKSSNIISGNIAKILKEKLDRRNIAAHPSGVAISDITAEEYIRDLIENVMLKLQ